MKHSQPNAAAAACLAAVLAVSAPSAHSQSTASADIPVTKVALFSSGVGYFEHSGRVSGDAVVRLPFRAEEVNDALKSLVVHGGENGLSPSVSYPSKADFERALRAFDVDLSGSPTVAELLARMRGAELEAAMAGVVAERVKGRILSVELRENLSADGEERPGRIFVALLAAEGVRAFPLDQADSFRFADPALDADFRRALVRIGQERARAGTSLELRLPGSGSRAASFGYVVAAPVWKATYRLDLSARIPYLQGWAVVDNATDRDWRDVSLSLISGRPVSFVQDLYAPVYLRRPVVPLAIAGAAAPRVYSSGLEDADEDESPPEEAEAAPMSAKSEAAAEYAAAPAPSALRLAAPSADRAKDAPKGAAASFSGAAFDAAKARSAGDQFEFTVARPVTLERGRSALLPLFAGELRAERVSVYTPGAGSPVLGARLVNSTGMKLPAGPITVFDDGVYAGDALLDFLPEKDARLIAFADDLALTVQEGASSATETVGVSVSRGVMTFSLRRSLSKTYEIKNSSARDKKVIVEHPESAGSELAAPADYLEKADGRYRFEQLVPADKQRTLTVVERFPAKETVALGSLNVDGYLRYSSNKSIPETVRNALSKAAELRRKADDASRSLRDFQARKNELSADQGRIRANLQSIGRDSPEGKKYLKRLLDSETEMDRLNEQIEAAKKTAQDAQGEFERYVGSMNF